MGGLLAPDFPDLVEAEIEHLFEKIHVFGWGSPLVVSGRKHTDDIWGEVRCHVVLGLDLGLTRRREVYLGLGLNHAGHELRIVNAFVLYWIVV